jgi:hypothetical protein
LAEPGEIEIGLFSRQCLGKRRILDLKTLQREAEAWNGGMNRSRVRINWRVDRNPARRRFDDKTKSSKRSENQFSRIPARVGSQTRTRNTRDCRAEKAT